MEPLYYIRMYYIPTYKADTSIEIATKFSISTLNQIKNNFVMLIFHNKKCHCLVSFEI